MCVLSLLCPTAASPQLAHVTKHANISSQEVYMALILHMLPAHEHPDGEERRAGGYFLIFFPTE